ncbi:MAG: LuxR C-terminal-related transcriptional regulator [Pirellula sp.]|jgi:DNA-binding CsgD family transcriptional regulator|nr:LuxR C-terminal-related transcriptional regulator [Pirellula sp.]
MDIPKFSSVRESNIESLLYQPHRILASFFDAANCDLVLYIHDMDRRLTYLSDSAKSVCDLSYENWKRKNFELMFTTHPWNKNYRELSDRDLRPGEIQILRCEIYGDSGKTIQLEVRRHIILFEEEPIGVLGITRVLPSIGLIFRGSSVLFNNTMDGATILARWGVLTQNEKEVVEHVVAGDMNKTIAKKLAVAERTVEARRSKVMKKLGLKTVPDLVRFHLLVRQWEEANRANIAI